MYSWISVYIKPLFLPPVSLILLAVLGWLIVRRRPALGRTLIALSMTGLLLLSLPVVSNLLSRSLNIYPALDPTRPVAANSAIVVLAAGMYRQAPEYGDRDTAGTLTLERLRYAAKLQRETGRPILATGGIFSDLQRPLAEAMAEVLTEEFRAAPVWTEPASRTTFENAAFSAPLLRSKGVEAIYLVTHGWHMPRAVSIFETTGLQVIAAPTRVGSPSELEFRDFVPSAGAFYGSYFAIHEWIGRLWYWLVYP